MINDVEDFCRMFLKIGILPIYFTKQIIMYIFAAVDNERGD